MHSSLTRLASTIFVGVLTAAACTSAATSAPDEAPSASLSIPITPAAASPTVAATPASASLPTAAEPTPQPTPVPVPPKPTEVVFDEQVRVSDDELVLEITQMVSWGAPRSEGVEIQVYGVTECIAEPADPPPGSSGPCLVVHTPLPASVRTLLATAPASDGVVSWTWTQPGGDCDIGYPANDRDGPAYFAVVLAAYGPSDHSIFAIAEPGGWWRPALGEIVC